MNDNKTPQTIEEENEALLEKFTRSPIPLPPPLHAPFGVTLSSVCVRTSSPLSR